MFSFNVSNKKNKTHINISGELTIYSAGSLFNEYVKVLEFKQDTFIDLSDVEELDTAGAQVLLVLIAEASRQDIPCHFTSFSEAVTRYLCLFNLESNFPLDNEIGKYLS